MYHFQCPQCGAPAPAPPLRVCPYCKYQYPVAAGTHAPDGFGLNWLFDRARAHLSAIPAVQLGNAIDARSLDEARRSYARGALPDEPIVALHNPGLAMEGLGWAITQRRFCWGTHHGPRELAWRDLDASQIVHVHPSLTVMGAEIPVQDPTVASALAALLRVLALTADAVPNGVAKAKFDDATLIETFRRMVPASKSLYVSPDIPADKEQNARAAYGYEIHPAERVLALYDATWFGSADEGWLLTARRVYATASWGPVFVDLANIVSEGVAVLGEREVSIQMKVGLTGPSECFYQLAGFFRSLAKY